MVLIAVKQIEQPVLLNNVENVSILGLDQGCILLFSATSTSATRNPPALRTVIGGIQLSDGEQKIYHRHPSCVKITHASINAARSLCCFVTRTELNNYDVFVAEICLPNAGRLFSVKFSRSSPVRAYLAPYDVILLLYRDTVTVFRMPNNGNTLDRSAVIDKDAQINECTYYQWDTLQQRLHIIQKRPPTFNRTMLANGFEAFVYTAYAINAKGQFDSIMKIDFDLKLPSSSPNHSNFEILSNDKSLFVCWQSVMKEETEKAEYGIISLGHGRSLYISKSLNRGNWEIFQSRKIHFGLLDGDYVFAVLRGEFVHLLNFNIQLNFHNHLFFPNDTNSLPYDTKYTTQRGLVTKTPTLLYEKKNLFTYTIEINSNELIKSISSITIESIIPYGLIALKDNNLLGQILEKILFYMYDDLNTKKYIKEILTALIFLRLAKRNHHNKDVYIFRATTIEHSHANDTEVSFHSIPHHREYIPEHCGTTNIDQVYYDKLRSSFIFARKYRHKVSHQIITNMDEIDLNNDIGNEINQNNRLSVPNSPTLGVQQGRRSPSPRFMNFGGKNEPSSPFMESNRHDNQRSFILLDTKNKYLFNSISRELQQLRPGWELTRIKQLAYDYVQATQSQCDYLIKLFTRLARFDRTQGLMDADDQEPSAEKYKTLLVVIEKLYLAMDELGFSPTEELQRTLLEVSFRVMPFDRFIAAIDQNILILTEEFVSRVISELDDDQKSYEMKEQLILMLPNINSNLHSRLFSSIENNRAKRMTAQLIVARGFSTDNRKRSATPREIDEMMYVNSNQTGTNIHNRLVEQAAVTFFRDCNQRGIFVDDDEIAQVETGLFALASPEP